MRPRISDLDLRSVEARLTTAALRGNLHHHQVATSTNTLALAAAQSGMVAGVWIADEQSAGRGRGGHAWHSASGDGLYLSALVRPRLPLARALWLSLATGLAAQRAIFEVSGLRADIRWPNDLLLGGRKCGGILVETASDPAAGGLPAMLRYAVIGVGINVNHAVFPPDLTSAATSLAIESCTSHSREPLIVALLNALDAEVRLLEEEAAPAGHGLLQRFTAASTWVCGKPVHVAEAGGYTGVTAGLDPQGFLRVTAADGTLRTVLSGGVRDLKADR